MISGRHFLLLEIPQIGPFAIVLLANSFGREPLYGRLKRVVNKGDGICLHVRQHVRVEVERNPHLAVPQPLAGDLRMDAGRQQMGSHGRVSEVVKADTGRGGRREEAHPLLSEAVRLQRRSVGLGHDEVVLR
jgi:hypothetical protein